MRKNLKREFLYTSRILYRVFNDTKMAEPYIREASPLDEKVLYHMICELENQILDYMDFHYVGGFINFLGSMVL